MLNARGVVVRNSKLYGAGFKLRVKTISLVLAKDMQPGSVKVSVNGKAVGAGLNVKDGQAIITLAADAMIKAGEALQAVVSSEVDR